MLITPLKFLKEETASSLTKKASRGNSFLPTFTPVMVNELTAEQYKATRTERMRDISDVEGLDNDYPATNIWEYVKELVIAGVLPRYVWDNQVVEMLSRNNDDTYDHILLPTNEENIFVTIIIDLEMEEILGHYVLDVNA